MRESGQCTNEGRDSYAGTSSSRAVGGSIISWAASTSDSLQAIRRSSEEDREREQTPPLSRAEWSLSQFCRPCFFKMLIRIDTGEITP